MTTVLVAIFGLLGVVISAVPAYVGSQRRQLQVLRQEADLLTVVTDSDAKAAIKEAHAHSAAKYRDRVLDLDKPERIRRQLLASVPFLAILFMLGGILILNTSRVADALGWELWRARLITYAPAFVGVLYLFVQSTRNWWALARQHGQSG